MPAIPGCATTGPVGWVATGFHDECCVLVQELKTQMHAGGS